MPNLPKSAPVQLQKTTINLAIYLSGILNPLLEFQISREFSFLIKIFKVSHGIFSICRVVSLVEKFVSGLCRRNYALSGHNFLWFGFFL